MAKGKKRSAVQGRTAVSKPIPKATMTAQKADSPKGIPAVVDGAEVHVSIRQNDKQSEAVQLKLSYEDGKPTLITSTTTTPTASSTPTPAPATPVAVKAAVPTKPAEPAGNSGAAAKAAAPAPAPAAAAPVVKRSFMSPSGIYNANWTRYIDLVAQAYTYPAYYTAGAAVGVLSAVTNELSNHLPAVVTKRK